MNNKCLAQIKINNKSYSIRATIHAIERMNQRNVDEYVVAGTVLSLGEARILKLQQQEEDAIIIDKEKNIAVVITFQNNTIKIVTVINKSNVFVKSNTTIERI